MLGGAGSGLRDVLRPLPTQQRAEATALRPAARKGSGSIAGPVCKGGGAGGEPGAGTPALGDCSGLSGPALCAWGPCAAGWVFCGSHLDIVLIFRFAPRCYLMLFFIYLSFSRLCFF